MGGKKRRVTEEVEMEGRDRGRCVLVDILMLLVLLELWRKLSRALTVTVVDMVHSP